MDMYEMFFFVWCGCTIADILVVSNYCSYIKSLDTEKMLNKNKVEKQIENEYKNSEYIKIDQKEIKKIATNILKEDNLFVYIYKVYLVLMFIIPLLVYRDFFIDQTTRALYMILNFINLMYAFVVLCYRFYRKSKNGNDSSIIDFFVKYKVFEELMKRDLIDMNKKIPDRYCITSINNKEVQK